MTSQATCYFPDKSIATGYELCNSTLAGPNGSGSACCVTGDICTTGGFCLNDMYYPYRGACTDKSWNSASCATECLNGKFSFALDIYSRPLDRYWLCIWVMLIISVLSSLAAPFKAVAAVPCGDSGNYNGLFCCSLEQSTSCCNATFGNIFGKPFAPATLAAANASDNNGSSTTTVTTVTATPTGHSSSDATKVGVGVGVPLGLLLLLSLVFAAWIEWRRRRDMKKVARETGWSGEQRGKEKSQAYAMDGMRHEIDGEAGRIHELGDGEADAAGKMF